ncbi:dihydrofolate reductase-like domain-containing protein, partial [Phlyctochytrium arcticum]
PWITLTYAQSLDGFIGGPNGTPLTLSSPASFTFTHGLRATHDAILVGVNTVIADNPSLTTRLVSKGLNGLGAENPRPIVLDGHLRVPETAKIFSFQHRPGYGPIIITAGNPQDQEKQARLESLGATILCVPGDSSTGRINMKLALQQLFSKFRVRSVMIEGGATVIQTVLKDETLDIDLLAITIAPKFVG